MLYGSYPDYDYRQHKRVYGLNPDGSAIQMPVGWKLVPGAVEVPSEHREFVVEADGRWVWCQARSGRSTMTPIAARCWGHVMAFATPEHTDMSLLIHYPEIMMYDPVF